MTCCDSRICNVGFCYENEGLFDILRDLFLPQPRNACPHCGGVRCIGACQFNEEQVKKPVSSAEPGVEAPATDVQVKGKS